jgi:hypothetical protein
MMIFQCSRSSRLQPVGLLAGLSVIPPSTLPELHEHVSLFLSDLPEIRLPGFDLSRVETEWIKLKEAIQIPEVWKLNADGREFQVGEDAKARGLSAKYPVVLVPGVISTVSEQPVRLVQISLLNSVVRALNLGPPPLNIEIFSG